MLFCLVLVVSVVLGSSGICVKSVPLSSQSFLTGLVLQAGFSGRKVGGLSAVKHFTGRAPSKPGVSDSSDTRLCAEGQSSLLRSII